MRRGLVACDQEEDEHREQLREGEARALELRRDQRGEQVVARLAPARLDQAHEVGLELAPHAPEGGDTRGRGDLEEDRAGRSQERVGPRIEARTVLDGHAEYDG